MHDSNKTGVWKSEDQLSIVAYQKSMSMHATQDFGSKSEDTTKRQPKVIAKWKCLAIEPISHDKKDLFF